MQAPAYNRTTDFASRDGDETDHAALNAELDGAAQSINALRANQALIQADDGSLKAGIVGADALAPDAFEAVLGAVADSVDAAQAASQSALTSATTAGNSANDAQGSADSALTSQNAAGLAAQSAAQSALDCADALAASQLVPEQLVHKDGSVAMTAGLPLVGNAAQPLHAVPLQQAQTLANAAQTAATSAAATAAAGLYLRKDGSTPMTAGLPLSGNAAAALHAVPLQQAQALIAAALQGVPAKNRVINGAFAVNQESFVGGARTAGQYGHDMWKAGAGGATYTVAGETATITAGTLVQVIDGLNVREGGTFTLSWSGTAQARIDGGSYAASPITVTGKTAGANTTIEFGTGTVTKVQYEAGASPTAFERLLFDQEVAACQRYFWILGHAITLRGYGGGAGAATFQNVTFPTRMRANPTISTNFVAGVNNASQTIFAQSADGFVLQVNSAGASDYAATYAAGNTASSRL